ncbi:hypothetical protein AB0M29_13745 [Streptomyces sp. NPDC051976]|uniref:hypothetical protein n=1 Tax=Streptomyces sp. NPDC051976 TaxID=3154947 RepID=UPI0034299C07
MNENPVTEFDIVEDVCIEELTEAGAQDGGCFSTAATFGCPSTASTAACLSSS